MPKKFPEPPESEIEKSQPTWLIAAQAAESRKAIDLRVLDLRDITSFADYFLICSGANQRQIQAISDAVAEEMKKIGETPVSWEGYNNAEWVLMDYGDLIVHVFTEKSRTYYDLERLWRHAKDVTIPGVGASSQSES